MEEQNFNLMKIAGKLKKYLDEERAYLFTPCQSRCLGSPGKIWCNRS